MKKVLLILLSFLYVSNNVVLAEEIEKTKFVNPVFNQPLRPMSMRTGYVYLTPTSVDFRTPLDKDIIDSKGSCELLENAEDHIKMFCKVRYPKDESRLKYAQNILKNSSDEISKRNAEITAKIYSGKYTVEEYYIYKVVGLFFEGCLDIEEISYKKGQQEYASKSYYCVTPPKDMATTD